MSNLSDNHFSCITDNTLFYLLIRNYLRYEIISIKRHPIPPHIEDDLHNCSPDEFEEIVAAMFRLQGYHKVKVTPKTKDYGADIIMEDKKRKYVVEVKKYAKDNLVDRDYLQKLEGAANHYRAAGMKFVTHGYFTRDAVEYSKEHNIHLIDGDELTDMYAKFLKR
jgi:restriction system protein